MHFVWYEYCDPCFLYSFIYIKKFSHLLTFSLCMSFVLKGISCRQDIVGCQFLTQSATLCLLIGTFSPFTFKVIIDRYVFIAIYYYCHLVFLLILYFFFFPFDDFLLYYARVLFFFVFVNLLYVFDLWLPCFSII